mmetsp:Transcript_28779/g.63454  ORF Transcript_28779/g.63454 Transcript_28779/m.63454 type:complete len:228 (+) Transcript_28779:437-1120(+)
MNMPRLRGMPQISTFNEHARNFESIRRLLQIEAINHQIQLADKVHVTRHVSIQNALNDNLSNKNAVILRAFLQYSRLLLGLKEPDGGGSMHAFQDAHIIVHDRQILPCSNQKRVIVPRMRDVVAQRSQDQRKLLQRGLLVAHCTSSHEEHRRICHVRSMRCVVKRIVAIQRINFRQQSDQHPGFDSDGVSGPFQSPIADREDWVRRFCNHMNQIQRPCPNIQRAPCP